MGGKVGRDYKGKDKSTGMSVCVCVCVCEYIPMVVLLPMVRKKLGIEEVATPRKEDHPLRLCVRVCVYVCINE
jgi:hypothetical protein